MTVLFRYSHHNNILTWTQTSNFYVTEKGHTQWMWPSLGWRRVKGIPSSVPQQPNGGAEGMLKQFAEFHCARIFIYIAPIGVNNVLDFWTFQLLNFSIFSERQHARAHHRGKQGRSASCRSNVLLLTTERMRCKEGVRNSCRNMKMNCGRVPCWLEQNDIGILKYWNE